MNKANILAVLAIFIISVTVFAAPLPLQLMVNNDTMQCASLLPGDECMDCIPPDGWEILGPYGPCPEGYTLVTIRGNCQGFENERCCTEGHSGASGDCRNLVKNDLTKECALLAGAANLALPSGWTKMPENASPSSWLCPHDYKWTRLTGTTSTAVSRYGPVNVAYVTDDADFSVSPGNNVSGWTWLTQPGQSAAWTFYNLPINRRLYIYLAPLVTRPAGNGGGSGYSTDVRITYETQTKNINSTVSLRNTHPEFKMPADTMGWGYQAIGYLMIPADKIPLNGTVIVTLTKFPNAEHIAVNKECCTVEYV